MNLFKNTTIKTKVSLVVVFLFLFLTHNKVVSASPFDDQVKAATQQESGIVKDSNGQISTAPVGWFSTNYGELYNAATPEKKALMTPEMSKLYDTILPLEQQLIGLNNDANAGNQSQRTQLALSIAQAKVAFKTNLGLGATTEEATAAQLQGQVIFCLGGSGVIPTLNIPGCIAIVSYEILYLTSWVLWVAALMFDWTIAWSLSMRDIVNSFAAIQYGWETFRNVINLFFILILVYISIATILQISGYGYKQLLGKLVIAAFLINFSMFFTEIIIDLSNMTALVFYKQIMVDADKFASLGSAGVPGGASTTTNQNLSLGIMNALGLQTIWGVGQANKGLGTASSSQTQGNNPAVTGGGSVAAAGTGQAAIIDPWKMTLVGLGGSVFILILSFIFFAASLMFMVRVLILIILIITSPIAFSANVLPGTKFLSDKWWKQLNSNVLFAPVYMALMFITLKMIWGGSNHVTNLLSLLANESASGMQSIVFFLLLSAMLVACLTVASSLGATGSKTMQSWGKSASSGAKKFAINRAAAPVSYIADKASKNAFIARNAPILLQGADKLAQAKLGGTSTYRSRVADDKKMYQARGDLVKNAVTGELIRGRNESLKAFDDRKKNQTEAGEMAQRKQLGVGEGNENASMRFNKGAQQARQDFMNKSESKSKDKEVSAATVEKNQKEISTGAIALISSMKASGALKNLHPDEAKKTEDIMKEITDASDAKKEVTPEMIGKLVQESKAPIDTLSKTIATMEKNMERYAGVIKNTRDPSMLLAATQKLGAMQASHTIASQKRTDIKNLVEQQKALAKRSEDIAMQQKLRTVTEENKPKV